MFCCEHLNRMNFQAKFVECNKIIRILSLSRRFLLSIFLYHLDKYNCISEALVFHSFVPFSKIIKYDFIIKSILFPSWLLGCCYPLHHFPHTSIHSVFVRILTKTIQFSALLWNQFDLKEKKSNTHTHWEIIKHSMNGIRTQQLNR